VPRQQLAGTPLARRRARQVHSVASRARWGVRRASAGPEPQVGGEVVGAVARGSACSSCGVLPQLRAVVGGVGDKLSCVQEGDVSRRGSPAGASFAAAQRAFAARPAPSCGISMLVRRLQGGAQAVRRPEPAAGIRARHNRAFEAAQATAKCPCGRITGCTLLRGAPTLGYSHRRWRRQAAAATRRPSLSAAGCHGQVGAWQDGERERVV
jgi:hypothetical protein